MNWCPRCGGPLVTGICENCSTVEERRTESAKTHDRLRADLRRFVETFTAIAPDETPIAALLRAILSTPDTYADAYFERDSRIVVSSPGQPPKTIPLPWYASISLGAMIEYAHLIDEARPSRLTSVSFDGIPLASGKFTFERTGRTTRIRHR